MSCRWNLHLFLYIWFLTRLGSYNKFMKYKAGCGLLAALQTSSIHLSPILIDTLSQHWLITSLKTPAPQTAFYKYCHQIWNTLKNSHPILLSPNKQQFSPNTAPLFISGTKIHVCGKMQGHIWPCKHALYTYFLAKSWKPFNIIISIWFFTGY